VVHLVGFRRTEPRADRAIEEEPAKMPQMMPIHDSGNVSANETRPVVRSAAVKRFFLALAVLSLAACTNSSGSTTSAPEPTSTTTTAPGSGPAVPSAGCGTSTEKATDADRRTLTVDGEERWYLLTTPPAHDGKEPLPLVLDFHGLAEGAAAHTAMSDMGTLAKKEGFVVAFPNGTGQPVRWDLDPKSPDLTFIDTLLDTLGDDLCIDTSRVYASGLSFGALLSSYLACERADRFAAVAPVAGITVFDDDCTPSRPVPVVAFHGTADKILRFNGGVGAIPGISKPEATTTPTTLAATDLDGPGYPEAVKKWAARNGCEPTPTDTDVTKEVVKRVYTCPAGQNVEFFIVEGGGHAWPGSKFSEAVAKAVGYTTMDINATEEAWKFFQRFQLPPS
jgi:polyhydroxybutyrate depolymerase